MTRWRALLLTALLLAALMPVAAPGRPARAEEVETWIAVSADPVLPGQSVIVSFSVPGDGTCDIDLLDENGAVVAKVAETGRLRRDTTPFTGTEPGRDGRFPKGNGRCAL
jgi:hypothetical protein